VKGGGTQSRRLGVVAIPRDPNPYQELLYKSLRAKGARVRYAGTVTPSHSLNLLLLPFELACLRLLDYNICHLHWVFGFAFKGARSSRLARRLSRLWFTVVLRIARRLGFRLVWTAHNVLPHAPVFDDDIAARRVLVEASNLVIAHSSRALSELASLGAPVSAARVIPHGPIAVPGARGSAPLPTSRRTVVAFGRIEPYKGIDDLLEAADGLCDSLRVVIAGSCRDRSLRDRLEATARAVDADVELSLEFVPDDELPRLLARAHALVFPFRSVTTSGSVLLGLSAGRAAVVPALDGLSDLPDSCVIRYPPGIEGLRGALAEVALMPAERLAQKGAQAARFAGQIVGWDEIAVLTIQALQDMLEMNGSTCTG
jgi:glycosyltransferase involved in cell wall biosynthesis